MTQPAIPKRTLALLARLALLALSEVEGSEVEGRLLVAIRRRKFYQFPGGEVLVEAGHQTRLCGRI
jgi:hypothetical protein